MNIELLNIFEQLLEVSLNANGVYPHQGALMYGDTIEAQVYSVPYPFRPFIARLKLHKATGMLGLDNTARPEHGLLNDWVQVFYIDAVAPESWKFGIFEYKDAKFITPGIIWDHPAIEWYVNYYKNLVNSSFKTKS